MKPLFIPLLTAVVLTQSSQAATSIDFGNSTATSTLASGNTTGNITWAGIGTVGGVAVDLIADLTGGTYQATTTGLANNGLSGSFGQLHTKGPTTLEFTFTLVEAGTTTATLMTEEAWELAMFDIDGPVGGEKISVQQSGHNGYTVSDSSVLTEQTTATEDIFLSSGGAVDNPSDPNQLTAAQQNVSVEFNLDGKDSFVVEFTNSTNGGRNFTFATSANIDTPAQAVPEPSSSLLILASSVLLLYRKRQ